MARLAWITDIHLDCASERAQADFLAALRASGADAILLGGDIGDAHSVSRFLESLAEALSQPIYFVLGNHDYYHGSIAEVRAGMAELCRRRPTLRYLTAGEVVPLSTEVALVGHDGWADARLGDYERSYVMMSDYKLIRELAGVDKRQRWPLLRSLGDAAAEELRPVLREAVARFPRVICLTHVPPWREACWYNGQLSNDEWLPHFTCQALGATVSEVMREFPQRQLTVLCGHTHSAGRAWILPNVEARTAAAEYGRPAVAAVWEV